MYIGESLMTADRSEHTAILRDDGWLVSWLPERYLSRNEAITALSIADALTGPQTVGDALVMDWLDELGLSWERLRCLGG